MRSITRTLSWLSVLSLIVFISCQKEVDKPYSRQQAEEAGAANNNKEHGHLQQTKTFSSDALLRWMDFQLGLYKANVASVGGPVGMRLIAYTSITAYESVVPGMPSYQSLSGQLTDMPAMPETQPGYAYYWPECLNAAMSYISKNFLPPVTKTPDQIAAINNFEALLHSEFASQGANAQLLDRSAAFGRQVAERIVQWSTTDRAAWPAGAFTTPTTFDVTTGKWIPTGTLATVVVPYWGYTRKLVANSLSGINSLNPFTYSNLPGSDFYKMNEQIYNNTYNPYGYTADERKLINTYFRDNPGYGSGHYMSIIKQVLDKAGTALDISALVFAQAGIASMDASIGCWKLKYDQPNNYVVRPFTYIKNVILADPASTWTTIMTTPNHPEYPSGHSTLAGAVGEVLARQFGPNFAFTDATYEGFVMPGYPNGLGSRHYSSFDDMMQEIGDSRVYGQIHYPQSCLDGKALGKKVAQNVLSNIKFLKE
ncbi:MAG TPA: vanadium-dependent haloperoxidase [Chitinophagaceae bacterium]|nr:vanadium-dependent haloperoxidase [Chitinophagaceae bacterium]